MDDAPNPGSDAAIERGCTCAVFDNNHGKHAPWPPSGWFISAGCPVHDPDHSYYLGVPLNVEPITKAAE